MTKKKPPKKPSPPHTKQLITADPPDSSPEITTEDLNKAVQELLEAAGFKEDDPRAQVVISAIQSRRYIGPIPSPETLAEYDKRFPGLADTIIKSWTKQQSHRQRLEKISTDRSEDRMSQSQKFALIVAICSIIAAAIVGIWGHWLAAGIIVLAGVGGPNAATILSRYLPRLPPQDRPNGD